MPARLVGPSTLIEAACSSHGGLDAWLKVRSFEGAFRKLDGPIPIFKGIGATFDRPSAFSVYPHQRKAVFHNYPSVERETTFDGTISPARMLVVSRRAPRVELPNYRARFHGLTKWRRWSPTDAACSPFPPVAVLSATLSFD